MTCRKIEPFILRDASGMLLRQECLTCGRGLEAMPKGWRHIKPSPEKETPMDHTPAEAIARTPIASALATFDNTEYPSAGAMADAVLAAIREAGLVLTDPEAGITQPSPIAIKALVEGLEWTTDSVGTYARLDTEDASNALDWACPSCRDDVGWAKHASASKADDGFISITVECGHCGYDPSYDLDGNDLD